MYTRNAIKRFDGLIPLNGTTMQSAMDMRLASGAARFGFVFARRGITPEAASTWFMPRIVGISNASLGRVASGYVALAAQETNSSSPPLPGTSGNWK